MQIHPELGFDSTDIKLICQAGLILITIFITSNLGVLGEPSNYKIDRLKPWLDTKSGLWAKYSY